MSYSDLLPFFNQTISTTGLYYHSIGEIQSSVGEPFSQLRHLYGKVIDQYTVPSGPMSLQSYQGVVTGSSLLSPVTSSPFGLISNHWMIAMAALILLGLTVVMSVLIKR